MCHGSNEEGRKSARTDFGRVPARGNGLRGSGGYDSDYQSPSTPVRAGQGHQTIISAHHISKLHVYTLHRDACDAGDATGIL